MTGFKIVIPARYHSTRLPAKVLRHLAGVTMIERVWRCARASSASEVWIATDDSRIVDECRKFTDNVLMTRQDHRSGTDRLAECAQAMLWPDEDILVNLQGDEPLTPAEVLTQVANLLVTDQQANMATLRVPITSGNELFDPNCVKVVCDDHGHALYFSRAPIPWDRKSFSGGSTELAKNYSAHRHVGIYAYRVGFLKELANTQVNVLENSESLEQLRALAMGAKIAVATACEIVPAGVDSEEDCLRVERDLGACI